MLDQPLRRPALQVVVQEDPRVVLELKTLDDEAAGLLFDHLQPTENGQGAELQRIPSRVLFEIFDRHVRSVEGLSVAGEPFRAGDERHIAALPRAWKIQAVSELAIYEFQVPEELAKNSSAPGGHSQQV